MKGKGDDGKGASSKLKGLSHRPSPRSGEGEGGASSSSGGTFSRGPGGRKSWTVQGWLAHIGVPDLVGDALGEGQSGDALDMVKNLGGLPNSSAVLEVLRDEKLLTQLAERIWEEAKRARKSDTVEGTPYDELLSLAVNGSRRMNDAEKLPEALRDFTPLLEEPDIAPHLASLKEYEEEVLSTGADEGALKKLKDVVDQVREWRAGRAEDGPSPVGWWRRGRPYGASADC